MAALEMSCDVDGLGTCASNLTAVQQRVGDAANAGAQAGLLSVPAFGLMCGPVFVPPALMLQGLVTAAIQAASTAIGATANSVQECQTAIRAVDDDLRQRLETIGGAL